MESSSTEVGLRIVCAANRLPDGTLLVGMRHWDEFMHQQADAYGVTTHDPRDQGFLANDHKFYTREEAWEIAKAAEQIVRRCGGDEGCLYSENLY